MFNWFVSLAWYWHVLIGMVLWFSIQNLIINDDTARKMAERKNGFIAIFPVAMVLALIGLFNLVVAVFSSVDVSWKPASIESWVWLATIVGVILLVAYIVYRKAKGLSVLPWKN